MLRKKIFSLTLILSALVMILCSCGAKPQNTESVTDDYSGKRIAILTGSIFDKVAEENIENPQLIYYNSISDMAIALESGKTDAYIVDEPVWRIMTLKYPNHKRYKMFSEESYAFIFKKDSAKSDVICKQMNEFLSKCKSDGTLEEIDKIWFGSDESLKVVNTDGMTAENGTLSFAMTSNIGAPFAYVKDNSIVGYDVDIAVRFCREYGYGINISDCDFSGMISAVSGGKCDFGASCITITDERKENMMFSEPDYVGGSVLVVNDSSGSAEKAGFFASVKENFDNTFIRESRYKLFLSGLGTTLIVVILSLVLGSLFGFAVYLAYYRCGKYFKSVVNAITEITENTPAVVILMILFYVIFGNSNISGTAVSVIGFTLIFAGQVVNLLKVGVGAVDAGQREAALTLGYTENKAFMRVIFPQAAIHFLPGYRSAVVQLIKGTAIVGYIAVQDLTKVSDIVRSRTYEAFFPLIATAIMYFVFAVLMTAIIKRIEINLSPASRKKIRILRGVKRK